MENPKFVAMDEKEDKEEAQLLFLNIEDSEKTPIMKRAGFFKLTKHISLGKLKHGALVLFLLLANYLYMKNASSRCPYKWDVQCSAYFIDPNLPEWVISLIVSSLIFDIIFILGIWNKLIPKAYSYFSIINVLYLGNLYDREVGHGIYSKVFGFYIQVFPIIGLLLFALGQGIKICYQKRRNLTILSILFIILLIYYIKVIRSCSHWAMGLDGESIDNSKTCKIETPKVCIYDIFDGYFDMTTYFRVDCASTPSHPDLMAEFYPDAPIIGLARSEKFRPDERWTPELPVACSNHSVPLQSFDQKEAEDIEFFIDQRDKKNISLHVKLKKNETLIKERASIKTNFTGLSKNYIVIFVDTVSRARSFTVLTETVKWIEKFMNRKNPDREAFQFFKYHSIVPSTQINLYAALYGITNRTHEDLPLPEKPFVSIIKEFKEAGYITGHTMDLCDVSHVILMNNVRYFIEEVPFDHEAIAFNCDPNIYYPDKWSSTFAGMFSFVRHCLYGKDVYSYSLEYADQFWRTYKDQKKLLYMDWIDDHESTQHVMKYLDVDLAKMLMKLEQDNLLEDTTLLLYSDHGCHVALEFEHEFDAFLPEKALPAIYLILPQPLAYQYRVTIKENQQKFVYALNIHHTFKAMIQGPDSPTFNQSLFGNIPPNVTCADAFVRNQLCYCNYE